jgi:DNA-binding transcriptional LysR family regulator
LVTTDPDGKYKDRWIDVRWPGEAGSESATEASRPSAARTRISLGYASINYLIISQGAGYLPRRLVDPYLDAGLLHRAEGAPGLSAPVYLAWRTGDTRAVISKATTILKDLCVLAEKGELPPPFWRQMGQ